MESLNEMDVVQSPSAHTFRRRADESATRMATANENSRKKNTQHDRKESEDSEQVNERKGTGTEFFFFPFFCIRQLHFDFIHFILNIRG